MKKPVKIALVFLTVLIICTTAGYMLFVPTKAEVRIVESGVITQDFTESGKLVSTRDMVVTAGLGEVVVGNIAVQEGQRVKKGDLLVELEPGSLKEMLDNRLEQMEQRKLALEAQKKMTQSERTVALEQARSSYESAKWEYEMMFNEEWGIGDNLLDTAAEDMLQARYTWQEARNDPDLAGISINRAHSAYRQTVDSVLIARTQYSDDAKLYYGELLGSSKKIVSALENNNAAVDSVQAAIAEMDASIKLLKSQLGANQITAPFDGVAHTIAVKAGQTVTAGMPIISVASQQSLEVETYLLAADAMMLREGDMVVCQLENGESFGGKISFVAASAQERVSTVGIVENRSLVRIVPDKLPEGVGNGYGVDVKFSVVKAENVLSVPLTSIVNKDGSKLLYILQGGRAKTIEVTTGITASGYTEVTAGLEHGDTVILLPEELGLRNGSLVSIGS